MKPERIGPGLLSAIIDYQERGVRALSVRARSLGVAHVRTTQKAPRVPVFVRCRENANFSALAKYDIRINEPTGTVRTAYLPVEEVARLSDHKDVKRIGASRKLRPRLDGALPAVRIPQLRTRKAANGAGVVIGIVDSGIDPNHSSFLGRILRIWDQTLTGPGVTEGNFGLELTGPAISASRDTDGHGTHVAGIASGGDAVFNGVAPGADIIFVKTDFSDTHIASGIRYILRVAGDLKRPTVVNLSLGGHFDAHDGTDELSAIIDQESGPGRIIVCAAGNEGDENIHAMAKIKKGQTTRIRVAVPNSQVPIVLNGWYKGSERIEISIEPPTGVGTAFQGVIATGVHAKSFNLPAGRVILDTPGPDPGNGDMHFSAEIHPRVGAALLTPGTWKLAVRGVTIQTGRLDVWATDFEAGSSAQFLSSVSDDMKIGSPGCSAQSVTVGAFTTRNTWIDRSGASQSVGLPLNTLAAFSSPGPLRNNAKKPDVTAPGAMIISALSADSTPEPVFLVADPHSVVEAGTSMASPFVAGVVALLLQSNPALTSAAVKQQLKAASRIPGKAAGTFAGDWGFGLLNGDGL